MTGAPAPGPFLVVGATGSQGSAVVRHLLRSGARVRALTRRPEAFPGAPRAGVEVVRGDLLDPAALERACTGAAGVFLMTAALVDDGGSGGEVAQGVTAVDAAVRAGVPHLVFSSVASADRSTGIPHFETKAEIERHLAASGLSHAVVRPANFMENWRLPMFAPALAAGVIAQPLSADRPTQEVAADDIGALAAAMLLDPDTWRGRAVDLAGDERDMTSRAAAFGRRSRRPFSYRQVPWAEFRAMAGAEMTTMFRWFEDVGYRADVARLRAEVPQLTGFDSWLDGSRWTPGAAEGST